MSTVSVPLPDDMLNKIKALIQQGVVPNTSEAIRQAVRAYLEDQAVQAVFNAAQEPSLEGTLDDLATKL